MRDFVKQLLLAAISLTSILFIQLLSGKGMNGSFYLLLLEDHLDNLQHLADTWTARLNVPVTKEEICKNIDLGNKILHISTFLESRMPSSKIFKIFSIHSNSDKLGVVLTIPNASVCPFGGRHSPSICKMC